MGSTVNTERNDPWCLMLKLRATAEKCFWHLSALSWKAFAQHTGSDPVYPSGLP